ncbi:MAG: TonB-dependent receptor [Robiginitomaculum sp.]|nr:TonB-dependent receptor [Robiginitomaculum sp.]
MPMKINFLLSALVPFFIFADGTAAAAIEDEVIITASRRAQPAKDYAGSVAILDLARLQQVSPVHPAELFNEVAGVNIHRGSGQEHLTAIRSPVLTGGAGAGSFLYLEDGVPLRAAGFSNVNGLFEGALELAGRVEITKGPGSVLYGSNAVHGLINILSEAPLPTTSPSFDFLGNEHGYARLIAATNGALFNGRFHAGLSLTSEPGFRSNSGFDQQKLQIRYDGMAGPWALKTLATFQNLNQETAGFIKGHDAYKDRVLSASNPNPEAYRDGKTARFSVQMRRPLGAKSQLTLIPYTRWVDLSFLRHFVPGKAREDSGHKSIGLITTYESELPGGTYTLGLDSEYTKGFLKEFQPGPRVFSFIQGDHYDYDVGALVLSPYLQTRFDLGKKTKLNLGVRADYTRYDYHNNIDNGRFGRFLRIADRQDDYLTFAPKIGLTHDLGDTITLYGRYARGNRAPQVTDAYSLQINQQPGDIRPETLDSVEVGLKGYLSKIRFEAALFAMRKNNFFFRNANGFNVSNGKTHHKGAELSFDAPLGRFMALSGAFTLARHTYAFNDLVRSPSSSIHRGDLVDTAPKTLGYLQMAVFPTGKTNLSLKVQHVGKYFTDPGNTTQYGGHDVFTLRGGVDVSKSIHMYGRIDNLFDIRYADRADFAFGSERYFPGRPRTFFIGIRVQP